MSENHHTSLPEEIRGPAPELAVAGWLVDEWGRESFPASDPPSRWAGADVILPPSHRRSEGVER